MRSSGAQGISLATKASLDTAQTTQAFLRSELYLKHLGEDIVNPVHAINVDRTFFAMVQKRRILDNCLCFVLRWQFMTIVVGLMLKDQVYLRAE